MRTFSTVLILLALLLTTTAHAEDAKPVDPAPAPAPAAVPPKLEVTLDTSDAPDMADYAQRLKKVCEDNYDLVCKELREDGFAPPTKVTIQIKQMNGVAYTAGGTITCAAAYFKSHPDDVGAVVHELAHVVQHYRRGGTPGWVVEGVADYVRWFNYEPVNKRPHVNPRRAKYTDSYQTTAAFLNWINTNHADFVRTLNTAARHGQYTDEIWKKQTGQTVDELWAKFIESLQAK